MPYRAGLVAGLEGFTADRSFEIDKDGISQRFVLKCEPAESVVMAWQKR